MRVIVVVCGNWKSSQAIASLSESFWPAGSIHSWDMRSVPPFAAIGCSYA
jgi:hypothetical protein